MFHTYSQNPISGQKGRSFIRSQSTDLNFISVDLFVRWWVEARIRLPFFPPSLPDCDNPYMFDTVTTDGTVGGQYVTQYVLGQLHFRWTLYLSIKPLFSYRCL
ncbi:hypothetical protein NPIL_317841 [Nephila pilipes]|uniref:Uncharacterized protein n=1 Tax=Nephila pilipes TaxID=299642 RepID=A0A8X6QRA9_NEPPI|nr:hypothetical protein NPIL_317841 [Nephila pilipes]